MKVMEAKDVDINIVYKWLAREDDGWHKISKVNSDFEICDMFNFVDSSESKAILVSGITEVGLVTQCKIPISEYIEIMREERIDDLLKGL